MSDDDRFTHEPPEGAPAFHRLSFGAQLIVWATRKRLHLLRDGGDESCVLTAFRMAGLEPLHPVLMAVVDVLLCGASVTIQVHAVGCPCLAPHEVGIVNAVAHLQSGADVEAQRSFEPLLCPAGVRLVMPPLEAVARGLGERRMRVAAIEPPAAASAPPVSRAVH